MGVTPALTARTPAWDGRLHARSPADMGAWRSGGLPARAQNGAGAVELAIRTVPTHVRSGRVACVRRPQTLDLSRVVTTRNLPKCQTARPGSSSRCCRSQCWSAWARPRGQFFVDQQRAAAAEAPPVVARPSAAGGCRAAALASSAAGGARAAAMALLRVVGRRGWRPVRPGGAAARALRACRRACSRRAFTMCRCRIGGDGRGDQCAAAAARARASSSRRTTRRARRSPTTLRVPLSFPDVDFLFGMVDAAAAADAPADFLYHVGLDGAGLPGHEWLRRARRAPIPALLRGASTASRLVHLVRDPFELVVSAYLYHLSAPPEERWWLDEPALFAPPPCARGSRASWLEALRACDAAGGLAAEGARAIAAISPMAALSRGSASSPRCRSSTSPSSAATSTARCGGSRASCRRRRAAPTPR